MCVCVCDLDNTPTEDELESALCAFKGGKSGGKNGFTPELVKHVGASIFWNFSRMYGNVEEYQKTGWMLY